MFGLVSLNRSLVGLQELWRDTVVSNTPEKVQIGAVINRNINEPRDKIADDSWCVWSVQHQVAQLSKEEVEGSANISLADYLNSCRQNNDVEGIENM